MHAHSEHYAHELTTTRHALEDTKSSQGLGLEQALGPGVCQPPSRSPLLHWWKRPMALWANVSPIPWLMQGASCCLRRFSFLFFPPTYLSVYIRAACQLVSASGYKSIEKELDLRASNKVDEW